MAEQQFTTEEIATEEWRPVVGYGGIYSVSNLGRIRRDVQSPRPGLCRIGRILKPSHRRYASVSLCRCGKTKTENIHALVAAAFIGTRPTNYVVNHLDGIKHNNRLGNLEYTTPLGNSQHAARLGLSASGDRSAFRKHPELVRRGSQNPAAKLNEEDIKECRRLYHGNQLKAPALARRFGVCVSQIFNIVSGKNWGHI